MMDYEKAYKAVLQTATQWIKDGCTDRERICLECVFPELRESEDERTLNEIITFIEQALHSGGGVSVSKEKENKWLAYLEKQKEQKPVEWNEEKERVIKDAIYALEEVGGYPCIVKELKSLRPTKQEWSEEDETTIQTVIELLKTYFKEDDLIGLSNLKTAISPNDLVKRLKSLRPRSKEESVN